MEIVSFIEKTLDIKLSEYQKRFIKNSNKDDFIIMPKFTGYSSAKRLQVILNAIKR